MQATVTNLDFRATRCGVIMRPKSGEPHEAWGVLNPGGVRAPDGAMHLFPRLIAEGNYSRIGHARVVFDGETPVGVERLGIALEPHESYEVNAGGGGVDDPRVVYVPLLKRYVMTDTIAVSEDLISWKRLGLLRYACERAEGDVNACDTMRTKPRPSCGERRATLSMHKLRTRQASSSKQRPQAAFPHLISKGEPTDETNYHALANTTHGEPDHRGRIDARADGAGVGRVDDGRQG